MNNVAAFFLGLFLFILFILIGAWILYISYNMSLAQMYDLKEMNYSQGLSLIILILIIAITVSFFARPTMVYTKTDTKSQKGKKK